DARLAHPLETPAGLADERAEARRPLLIEREGGVAEIDLPDAVALDDVPELREDALRRLRAPRLALDEGVGAVVAARVRAAGARGAARRGPQGTPRRPRASAAKPRRRSRRRTSRRAARTPGRRRGRAGRRRSAPPRSRRRGASPP